VVPLGVEVQSQGAHHLQVLYDEVEGAYLADWEVCWPLGDHVGPYSSMVAGNSGPLRDVDDSDYL
jgi:2-succinyl-5-enolpyruvyl-6-hydroxy-3-cyclohexene-1-carboxylate synthase